MKETMMDTSLHLESVQLGLNETPIKLLGEPSSPEALSTTLEDARDSLAPYDESTRGTCMDERCRQCLMNNEITEVRPSAPGGPDVYALAVRELTGYFAGTSLDATQRAMDTMSTLRGSGIRSGGHKECAADNLLGTWAGSVIVDNQEAVSAYVERKITEDGGSFDTEKMQEIIKNAADIQSSGRYAEWTEHSYFDLLDEEAGQAIEILEDTPHLGHMMIWVKTPGYAIDQTKVNNRAFELNLPYMQRIENAALDGPAGAIAPYARYAVLAALALALPNPELQEGTISV